MYLSIYLSIYIFIYLSIYLYIYIYVYSSTYFYRMYPAGSSGIARFSPYNRGGYRSIRLSLIFYIFSNITLYYLEILIWSNKVDERKWTKDVREDSNGGRGSVIEMVLHLKRPCPGMLRAWWGGCWTPSPRRSSTSRPTRSTNWSSGKNY